MPKWLLLQMADRVKGLALTMLTGLHVQNASVCSKCRQAIELAGSCNSRLLVEVSCRSLHQYKWQECHYSSMLKVTHVKCRHAICDLQSMFHTQHVIPSV